MTQLSIECKLEDIAHVMKNARLSKEMRIDYVTRILCSQKNHKTDCKVFNLIVGDIIHDLILDNISDYRTYIPLILRIYNGLTGSAKTCYLGLVDGRKSYKGDNKMEPSIVLKAILDDAGFNWGTGKIYKCNKLLELIEDEPRIVDSDEGVFGDIEEICEEQIDGNAMILPLNIQKAGRVTRDPYGFITLVKKGGGFSETDLNLAEKVTLYFNAHLNNFEVLRKDPLTYFYNQRQKGDLLTSELIKAIHNNYFLSLILFDIDHFKRFNDKYGHLEGDSLLSQLGELVLKYIRPYDRPIRIGGEEFLLVVPKLDYGDLLKFAERLRLIISDHTFNDRFGSPAHKGVSASFGAVLLDNIDEGIADTDYYLQLADKNLYSAKRKGRNRIVTTLASSLTPDS